MNDFTRANRDHWDELTAINASSSSYDVEGFRRGRCTLLPLELEEVGDVSGKSLLHLQCHFGMETLSWARLGADATGVDISPAAIALAEKLSTEIGVPASFVCSDVYDLPGRLEGQFDIVYTSQGVLAWLQDLRGWAETIAHFLRAGGTFYMFEFHRLANAIDPKREDVPVIGQPYFSTGGVVEYPPYTGTYSSGQAEVTTKSYEWVHSMGEVVTALAAAGLRIEFLHEFPFCTFQFHEFLTQGDDGLWRYAQAPERLPLMFSIRAVKG